MNKRSAKKYIQYRIADAIELVSASDVKAQDEDKVQKKIDELLSLYDTSVTEVNKERRMDPRTRKKHFATLYDSLHKSIASVTGSKK